ncbi:M60 family metallopeptidase [Luteolibacter sp. GHJ8]|uniref:M60 family metallopeptidase n=1 Tax=Luteolibacter rhizosphaerae TaxID=2989719 RepID=A0ABT3FYT9_9BACT|nr:M60 family metallopeptidase [Luteolibacter rhizosphaerae]
MKPIFSSLKVLLVTLFAASSCLADLAADFGALTSGISGQAIASPGTSGTVAPFGAASFPVLLGTASPVQAPAAAGRHGDSYDPSAGRAVAFSHTGFFDTGAGARSTLFTNSILWASKQAAPAGTTVAIASSAVSSSFVSGLGYTTTAVGTNLTAANLSSAHVLVLSAHANFTASAVTNIKNFAAAGGGIVITSTPWALGASNYANANSILDPFGLCYSLDYSDDSSWTVAAAAYPAFQSALPAADALIADKEGTAVMSAANRSAAANAIFQVTQIRIDIPALAAKLALLSDSAHYGMIAPTAAAPINTTNKPVEKMIASYQSKTFDQLTPAQLFVHPSASDFPGLPTAGAATVTKTVTINGNTSVDFYMNQGGRPTRFETGLYAAPGATVTITIPGDKTAQGIQAHISPNGSQDSTFNITNWTFFPKLWRRVDLTQASTQTGHVMGGLITLMIPPGKSLGNFEVTISGAIEAPVFVLGQNTDAEWNATLKSKPAPYGYIQNSKLTIYVPKTQLAAMNNPEAVTGYWKQVMDIADEYYGYTTYRKRGEAIATARYVAAGAAYASYPIEAGWGTGSDEMLEGARINGHWGNYHELGHNYQDIFDGTFVIALSAEVDVNLFPGMIYTLLHDRTAWDGAHSTYDASSRLPKRQQYLALSDAEKTWQKAHDITPVAYDFYFNLSEAFGWQAFKTMLTRLMRYLQSPSSATDPALHALSSGDANFKRNRFYMLMCDATGRNLDSYFQRYGLGKVGAGQEITQSVKDAIAAKGYPVWTDNTPIDALSTPSNLHVSEDASPGTEIHQLVATDAEEPGTIWDYSITAGNTGNAFTIDRRTGKLRVQKVDAETLGTYNLTVQVQDNGVPRFSTTSSFTVAVDNVSEAPQLEGKLFTATSAMANGASLGTMGLAIEQGRTLGSLEIVAGNSGQFSINPATRAITVTNAASLPNPGVVVLTIRAIDSAGVSGFGTATILCNRSTGVLEERWPGASISGNPTVTNTFSSFTSGQNAAESYIRRVSGWLVPPASGVYTFWIASDDGSTLSLGADEKEPGKQAIASVSGYTGFQAWMAQPSQKSTPVFLQAGRAYYIEAIQQEGGGGDHVAVAWQGPGIAQQVIPGTALIPRNATSSFPASGALPAITITSPEEGAFLFVPGTFPITTELEENTLTISKVQFFDGETLIGEDATAPYSLDWVNPAPGTHALRARIAHTAGTVDSNARIVTVAAAGAPLLSLDSPLADEISIPANVGLVLESTVLDNTPASLAVSWSKLSGPGTVSFGNASAPDTSASFSAAGDYVLRLTASDGSQESTRDLTVHVGVTPLQLISADVNAPRTGSSSLSDGVVTISGAGNDIYGTSDQFHFYHEQVSGDFDFRARLASKTISSVGAHTALMARESLAANSAHAAVSQESSGSTYLMQRASSGASTSINIGSAVNNTPPTWMRLARTGNSIRGYISDDGVTWTEKGPITPALSGTVLLGFAVSNSESSAGAALNVATFDNISGLSSGNVGALVAAGPDQNITLPQTALAGSASDDGQPNPPGMLATRWTKLSGPGSANFANANSPVSQVSFSVPGNYLLRLVADDGQVKTFDDLAITMPSPFANWRAARFGAAAGDELVAGANADPNRNGIANLLEYAFGMDPEAQGTVSPVLLGDQGGRIRLTFTRDPSATDLDLLVQAGSDLSGEWVDLARSENGEPFGPLVPGVEVSETTSGDLLEVGLLDLPRASLPDTRRRFLRVVAIMP